MIFSEKPGSTFPDHALEIESRGEDPAVVVGGRQRRCRIVRRHRDLITDSGRKLYVTRERETADLAVEGRSGPGAVIIRIAFRPRRHTGRKLVTVRPGASSLK